MTVIRNMAYDPDREVRRRAYDSELDAWKRVEVPLAAALNAANTPGFTQYDLLPANWWFLGIACLALAAFLLVRTWQLTRPQ